MKFKEIKVNDQILKAITREGYETPSPIQEQAIPIILQGRDLIGCAQTGTGKTAAFAIPILHKLSLERRNPSEKREVKVLVLAPTRELALQVAESFKVYGRYTGLRTAVVFGGVAQNPQVTALSRGVDILVATPGRLNDLLNQRLCKLSRVSMLVLDEADRMLDMGFAYDVKRIISQMPLKRQTMLFSATMPQEIVDLAMSILDNPTTVAVTPISSPVDIIEQQVYFVDKINKGKLLVEFLSDESVKSALVFSRTKHGADKIQKILNVSGILAKTIHGDKSQMARQNALSDFKLGRVRVLVATDIAARGIDVDELSHVINFDLPNVAETYVHRIGRTGRAGLGGTAVSFCDFDEKEFLRDIQKFIKFNIDVVDEHSFPMQIFQSTKAATKKKSTGFRRETISSTKPISRKKVTQGLDNTEKNRYAKPYAKHSTSQGKKTIRSGNTRTHRDDVPKWSFYD